MQIDGHVGAFKHDRHVVGHPRPLDVIDPILRMNAENPRDGLAGGSDGKGVDDRGRNFSHIPHIVAEAFDQRGALNDVGLGDKRTAALIAVNVALGRQIAQGLADGHARDAVFLRQLRFSGKQIVRNVNAAVDLIDQVVFNLFITRDPRLL